MVKGGGRGGDQICAYCMRCGHWMAGRGPRCARECGTAQYACEDDATRDRADARGGRGAGNGRWQVGLAHSHVPCNHGFAGARTFDDLRSRCNTGSGSL